MNCRRIENLIPLYIGGDLASDEAALVSLHLESCGECSELAAQFRESQNWLRSSESPDFSRAELDALKQGVLVEMQRRNGRAALLRYFAHRWTFRRMIAATAALLVLCAALVVYLYYGKMSDSIDSGNAIVKDAPALKDDLPGGDERAENANEAPGAIPAPEERNRSTIAMKKAHRKARPVKYRSPVFASQMVRQQRIDAKGAQKDAWDEREMLRIEIQTSDPNIRIIWFAPKETDSNQSRPMTD